MTTSSHHRLGDAGPRRPAAGDVAAVIAGRQERDGLAMDALYRSVHGTSDPAEIAVQVEAVVRHALGAGVVGATFHLASAGSVTGVVLDGGTVVVVKAFQPRWPSSFLVAVLDVQRSLADAGLPCARPIAGPLPMASGLAVVESYLPDPGQPSTFGPDEMRTSAVGLAHLIDRVPRVAGLAANPLHAAFHGLYPTPHSPIFDFDATADGAEWIDGLAAAARPFVDLGRRIAVHTDWSARNVRLRSGGIVAIYDLDSLGIVALPGALAQAAVTWRSTAEPGDAPAPAVDEVEAWLDCYPGPLTADERRGVFANALYHHAYSGRCEHAVDPDGTVHQRARSTLRDGGAAFVERFTR